jgi:hypothetical protein
VRVRVPGVRAGAFKKARAVDPRRGHWDDMARCSGARSGDLGERDGEDGSDRWASVGSD